MNYRKFNKVHCITPWGSGKTDKMNIRFNKTGHIGKLFKYQNNRITIILDSGSKIEDTRDKFTFMEEVKHG